MTTTSIATILNNIASDEGDIARVFTGLVLGQMLGRTITDDDGYGDDPQTLTKTAVNVYGSGVEAMDRVASVDPMAVGDVLIAMTQAFGDASSSGVPVVLGRIAGPYDAPELIFARKAFATRALPVQTSQSVTIDDKIGVPGNVATTVRIPTNKNVTVAMLAYAQIRPATAATQVDMRIRIGGNTTIADPSFANLNGAVGPPSSAGKDTSVQSLFTVHARTFNVASTTDAYSDQNINLRWSCFGGSGNSDIRSAMMFGIKVVK